jgi:hypothetical protein
MCLLPTHLDTHASESDITMITGNIISFQVRAVRKTPGQIRTTFSTQQKQNIDEIIWEMMFIKAYCITNDTHGYLLLGQQYSAYHASHTHVRAVASVPEFWQVANHITVSILSIVTGCGCGK